MLNTKEIIANLKTTIMSMMELIAKEYETESSEEEREVLRTVFNNLIICRDEIYRITKND